MAKNKQKDTATNSLTPAIGWINVARKRVLRENGEIAYTPVVTKKGKTVYNIKFEDAGLEAVSGLLFPNGLWAVQTEDGIVMKNNEEARGKTESEIEAHALENRIAGIKAFRSQYPNGLTLSPEDLALIGITEG